MKLNIKQNDLVLEIGSGHKPHYRSDVLCDRYLFINNQRSRFGIRYDRPLVVALAEKLPFKDKAFDFVICNQVIEHSKDPFKFIAEIQRVGKRGVIVCPHAIREKIFGWQYHHWWITKESGDLVFRPKKKDLPQQDFFHKLYQKKVFFRRFCLENEEILNIYFNWHKQVPVKVLKQADEGFFKKIELEANRFLTQLEYNCFANARFLLNEVFSRIEKKVKKEARKYQWNLRKYLDSGVNLKELASLIICPKCKKEVLISGKLIKCKGCKESYPLEQGIPVFLDKKERSKGF